MSSTAVLEEAPSEEVLSNVDIDIEVTSSTLILGSQMNNEDGHSEDASMLVEGTTPVEMRQTNVTTVPKEPSTCWKTGARYCIVTFCCLNVVMLVFGGLWPALSQYSKDDHKRIVIIQTDRLVNVVNERFLSVALDSSLIRKNFKKFDMKSKAARMLGSSLSPCYLRVGGTAADRLIFVENHPKNGQNDDAPALPIDGGPCAYEAELCTKNHAYFNMSGEAFLEINTFAKTTGMDMIFDLNALLRNGKVWDDTNAKELLAYANGLNLKLNWQLGNEPNAYRHQFDEVVEATQLGDDYVNLRNLLNSYPKYAKSLLVGPDITRPRPPKLADLDYLREFLRTAGPRLNAVTWHQYNLNGREATLQDFLNVETYNTLYEQIILVNNAVRSMALGTPIWLGETGSAFGGGAPELSDRFVASFLWLDKLGVAASEGIHVVVRQSLYGGHYGLLRTEHKGDHKGALIPNPDFWVSILHKKLVGTGVVGVTLLNDFKGPVRIYCHCTEPSALHPGLGAVTIFGVNLLPDAIELSLQGTHNVSSVDRYILQGESGLQSQYVLLNGEKLDIGPNYRIPPLTAQPMDLNSPISMPEHSIGFWVLHGAQVPACQNTQ
ncbi:heparanase-like [Neocloeon triangulifer]|uniref:heparanase-like n=1 Tax=Neocloeon triangulifer TaxID=2078957 RepID=UPI00286EEEC5|nr:heparanase-like [Neocloeon triangulifer]